MTLPSTDKIAFINPPEISTPPGYSHVAEVKKGRIVYIAGQVALDRDGRLVGRGDFAAQADQVFANIGYALAAVGCTVRDLAKLTVFVRNMRHVQAYREARDRFFGTVTPPAAPASTLVETTGLFSEDFLIEIEAVAVAD